MMNIFVPILLLTGVPSYGDTIADYCKAARKIGTSFDPSDKKTAEKNLCNLEAKYSDNTTLLSLTKTALDALKKGTDANDATYQKSLQMLADSINNTVRPSQETADPLATKLNAFVNAYSSDQSRITNSDQYLRDLLDLIKKTKIGARNFECFNKDSDPTTFLHGAKIITKEEYLKQNPKIDPRSFTMEFMNKTDPTSGKIQKLIAFDPMLPPIEAALDVIHEMQHGCDAEALNQKCSANLKRASQDYKNAKSAGIKNLSAFEKKLQEEDKNCDEFRVAFEAKGYLSGAAGMKEFAKVDPSLVCNESYVSGFLGNQVVTLADYHSFVEQNADSGAFSQWQALKYVDQNMYKFENVLTVETNKSDPDEPVSFVLHPELLKMVQSTVKAFKKEIGF